MVDFLLEIGVEELPASYVTPALDALGDAIEALLEGAQLARGNTTRYATARRLTIHIAGLADKQESRDVELKGPPARIAFDGDGNPTKAAIGFAKKAGVDPASLSAVEDDKGAQYVVARKREEGRTAKAILEEALPGIVAKLPFPKSMKWNATRVTFARPIRSILALVGDEVVSFEVAGVQSGRATSGHPFLAPQRIELPEADLARYVSELEAHCVHVDQDARKAEIEGKIKGIAADMPVDQALLDEVMFLVEYPNILKGHFEEAFLALPDDVLEEAMKSHQRYFPVRGADGKLEPAFLCVFNRSDAYADGIRGGNERVLRARLADARFFWNEDRKTSLSDKAPKLSGVSHLAGLGTYAEKAARLTKLAPAFAEMLDLDGDVATAARRAAELAKVDLVTEMVGEFPKLQGVMGGHYALADGEGDAVARAIREHYLPRFADDAVPATPAGIALALADKLDHVTGCFIIGKTPSGRQDPYAVRRAVQGVIRIVLENQLDVRLSLLLEEAAGLLSDKGDVALDDVRAFVHDRLYQIWIDAGERFDLVRAVLATGFDNLLDCRLRLSAVNELAKSETWPGLVELVERTHNIAKKLAEPGLVDEALLEAEEEKRLWSLCKEHAVRIEETLAARRYVEGGLLYAETFAEATHDFFDKVYVNVDDEKVRANRLNLCARINRLFSRTVADLSDVETGEA